MKFSSMSHLYTHIFGRLHGANKRCWRKRSQHKLGARRRRRSNKHRERRRTVFVMEPSSPRSVDESVVILATRKPIPDARGLQTMVRPNPKLRFLQNVHECQLPDRGSPPGCVPRAEEWVWFRVGGV